MALYATGVVLEAIRFERERQVNAEGYSPDHDDSHDQGELAQAAMAYLQSSFSPAEEAIEDVAFWWPWKTDGIEPDGFKRKTRREDLLRAAALCVAEIERTDRLDRQSAAETGFSLSL